MAKRSVAFVAASMLAVALSVGGGTLASSAAGPTSGAASHVRCAVGFHPVRVRSGTRIIVRCVRNRPVMPAPVRARPRVTG